jgi:peptidoglycan/LPS O-acetylase OafA/YrhL
LGIFIILIIISIGVIYNYYNNPTYRTLLDNITFFYTGVLSAYIFNKKNKRIILPPYIVSSCQFILIILLLFINSVNSNILLQFIYILLIYCLFKLSLNYDSLINSFLKSNFISITGGMCYTIYLYHIVILLLFNKYIFDYIKNAPVKIFIFYVLYIFTTWIICSILYYLFEKPFMKNLTADTT